MTSDIDDGRVSRCDGGSARDDDVVVCPGCGDELPASELAKTVDVVSYNKNGAMVETSRKYICGEDCSMDLMSGAFL